MEIEKYKAVAYREFLWDSEDEDEGVEVVLASDHDAAIRALEGRVFMAEMNAASLMKLQGNISEAKERAEAAEAELAKVSGFIAQGAPVATNRALRAKLQAAEAALAEARAKVFTLKTGLDATEASEGMLEFENERLKAENAALRTRNERLVAWAKTLSENCTTFQERNRALRTENAANKALIEAWKPSHQIAQIVIAPDADDLEALRDVLRLMSLVVWVEYKKKYEQASTYDAKAIYDAIASRAATKGESE